MYLFIARADRSRAERMIQDVLLMRAAIQSCLSRDAARNLEQTILETRARLRPAAVLDRRENEPDMKAYWPEEES